MQARQGAAINKNVRLRMQARAERERDSAKPQAKGAAINKNVRLRMQARAERERDSAKHQESGAAIKRMPMKRLNAGLERLQRLFQIREAYVSVAEAGVKQAEGEVRKLEAADTDVTGNIQHTQAQIAYLQTATGQDLQSGEKYIQALQTHRKVIQQALEKAAGNLDQRRHEWTEAMRERKIIEKMQERRLHQWERENDVADQKTQDDASIGRYVRARTQYDRTERTDTDRS